MVGLGLDLPDWRLGLDMVMEEFSGGGWAGANNWIRAWTPALAVLAMDGIGAWDSSGIWGGGGWGLLLVLSERSLALGDRLVRSDMVERCVGKKGKKVRCAMSY